MRLRGALRTLAMVTIPERDWDEARIELAARHADALSVCNAVEPRLRRLHPVTALISPEAEQLCAGALYEVQRYRARQR